MTDYYTGLILGPADNQPSTDHLTGPAPDADATRPHPACRPGRPAAPQGTGPAPAVTAPVTPPGKPRKPRWRRWYVITPAVLVALLIGFLALGAAVANQPVKTTAVKPTTPAATAPVKQAEPATASAYVKAHGYKLVKSWSRDAWVKENPNVTVTPYLAKGGDVVAAGSKGGTTEFAFKVSDPRSPGVFTALQTFTAKDSGATIDGSYLVTTMPISTAGDVPGASPAPASSAPAQAPAPAPAPTHTAPAPTMGQQQALASAQDYLSMGDGFSRLGLIDQLSSSAEGYSLADATWAADHTGANWYKQAVLSAKSYLQTEHFSRQGLIDQLSSSAVKFTVDQATYAANQVYK